MRSSAQYRLLDMKYSIFVQPKDAILVLPIDYLLDIFAQKLVELLKDSLPFLRKTFFQLI